jgi:hypothetical protein
MKLENEINAPPLVPEAVEAPFEIRTWRDGLSSPISAYQSSAVENERVFDETGSSIIKQQRQLDIATGGDEPMRAAHSESPFEEPGATAGYGTDAFSIEEPGGMHETGAPMTAELPMPLPFEPLPGEPPPPPSLPEPVAAAADEADVFEPANSGIAPGIVTHGYSVTSSMDPIDEADFANDSHGRPLRCGRSYDEARDIYEDPLRAIRQCGDPQQTGATSVRSTAPPDTPLQPAVERMGDRSVSRPRNCRLIQPEVDKLEAGSRAQRV